MLRRRITIAALAAGLSLLSLTGCAATHAAPTIDQGWSNRMNIVLPNAAGQGGGGGLLTAQDGERHATSSATLAYVIAGTYDVLAVCTGASLVHLALESPERVSTAPTPNEPLASVDIACGATARVPVTVPTTGLTLTATSESQTGQWLATIVPPGWQPPAIAFANPR